MSELPPEEYVADAPTRVGPPPPVPPVGPPPPEEPPPASRIGLGMLVAIAALAIVAAVLAAIFFTRHHHKSAAQTTTIVTTAPAATTVQAQTTTHAPKLTLPVPDLVGKPWKQASLALHRAGFHVSFATVPSALPRGAVTAQDPKAGVKVARGSDVRLNLSNGAKAHSATTTAAQATTAPAQATTAPAQTGTTSTTATTTQQTTTAQQQTSTAATTSPQSSSAQGATAQVPSLSGDLQPALQQLDQAGFVASISYVPSQQPLGTVVAQSPSGGQTAKTNSQVTLNVSDGPNGQPTETVPNVVGQQIPDATHTLNGAGLRLVFLRGKVSNKAQAGHVIAQTPLPGKKAPKNAQVLVYMGAYTK